MSTSKVALVTGAAKRIGAEIALVLHRAGFNIVLHYNTSVKEAEILCNSMNRERQNSASIVHADLSVFSMIAPLVQQAAQRWGYLDVLVNNASRFYPSTIEQVTEKMWNDLFDSNLKSLFFLSQAAVPFLKARRGCIINLTDIHGERPLRDYSLYCMTKAGVIMLTKSLAKELAPYVRVNGISPGAILWPESDSVLDESMQQHILKKIPLGRTGSPVDIAQAILFLVRDADYITGQVIAVDGGRLLSG